MPDHRQLHALMAAGLVDRIQVTDLDLLETPTLDGRTQELVYRPTLRTWPVG